MITDFRFHCILYTFSVGTKRIKLILTQKLAHTLTRKVTTIKFPLYDFWSSFINLQATTITFPYQVPPNTVSIIL